MADKKYYWLKLDRNFFKRHDVRIIEDMPNGKEYVLFFMKLLVESIDHEGSLRFNELIPYNDQMLATITHTNIDIVRSAIKLFQSLNLLEIMDDKTIYIHDTTKMLGMETEWAQKKRDYRIKRIEEKDNERTSEDIVRQEIDKEKDLDKEKDKEVGEKRGRFTPPTQEDVSIYCSENNYQVDAQRFIDFYESKGWMVGKNKMKDWKASVRTWVSKDKPKRSGKVETPTNYPSIEVEDVDEKALAEQFAKLGGLYE